MKTRRQDLTELNCICGELVTYLMDCCPKCGLSWEVNVKRARREWDEAQMQRARQKRRMWSLAFRKGPVGLSIGWDGIRLTHEKRKPGQLWLTASSLNGTSDERRLWLIRRDFREQERIFCLPWSRKLWPRRKFGT